MKKFSLKELHKKLRGHEWQLKRQLDVEHVLTNLVLKPHWGNGYPSGRVHLEHVYSVPCRHRIELFPRNIKQREPAGFQGSYEQKLLFVLAHELVHVAQWHKGAYYTTNDAKYRPAHYREYLENQERYKSQWDEKEGNDLARDYATSAVW